MPTLTTVRWISDGEVITSILLNRPLSDLDTNITTLNSWADALIDDSTTSATNVWSSNKVASEINSAVTGGAGSGSDSDRLDGQHGAFYRNASNINDGTIGSTFLPDASTTAIGAVEKATTTEAQNGTAGKFPDAAGVKAHLDNRVTQTTVDTTVDRLLKVGDAGILGNAIHATSGSANDFVTGVTYIAVGNVVADLPSTSAIAYLVWSSGNTTVTSAVVQTAVDMSTGVEYTRIGTGDWGFKYSTVNNTNLVKKDVVGEVMDAASNVTHNLTIRNGGGSAKVLSVKGGSNNNSATELIKTQSDDGTITPFAVYGNRVTAFGKTIHSSDGTETVTDVLTSFTAATADHYVIGELDSPFGGGRGGFEFKVITSGGSDSPQTTTITGFKDWAVTGVINISGGFTVYGAAIIAGADTKYYVTVQFSESIEAGEVVTRTGTRNVFSPIVGALPTRASKAETSVIAEAKYSSSAGVIVGLNTSASVSANRLASVSNSPVFVLHDIDGTGAQQTGYISFQDNNDVEQAWLGFGTTGNSDFNIQNSYGTFTFNGSTVWHSGNGGSGSGLDADLLDGKHVTAMYREESRTQAIAGAGWVTVAESVGGRVHSEVIVTDMDSVDHTFIRIDWLCSFIDTNFSVANVGGNGKRITGIRVLEDSADPTYGKKYLQIYSTVSSDYMVRVNKVGDAGGYSSATAIAPVVENTKVGYQVTGKEVNGLDVASLASHKGITIGGLADINGRSVTSSDISGAGYDSAAIEIREFGRETGGSDTWSNAPRLSFHWGGATASQIGMNQSGTITFLDQGGTGYADIQAKDVYHNQTFGSDSTLYNALLLPVSSSNTAVQRVDTRAESTSGRAHWYGGYDGGGTDRFRHAWYDGYNYVNVDAINSSVRFSEALVGKGFIGTVPDASSSSDYKPSHIVAPDGAVFSSDQPSNTGFIKISFPNTWTDTMFRLRLKILDYAPEKSFTVDLAGYAYSSTSTWINTTAFISGNNANHRVRFGHDGTNVCIYIGESNSVWDYPSVVVEDVVVSYSNFQYTTWNDGWDISITPSAGTISATHTNTQLNRYVDGNEIYHAGNLTASEIQTTDITVTVGSGGDYSTINAALEALSKKAPQYKQTGVNATVHLLAGFVMSEQVICDGVDLSWITINGADSSTTVVMNSITQSATVNGEKALFAAVNGGKLPVIIHKFTGDGSASGKYGIYVAHAGSSAIVKYDLPSSGITGTGFSICIYADHGGKITYDGGVASATSQCLRARRGGEITCNSEIFIYGNPTYGLYADNGGKITCSDDVNGSCSSYGAYSSNGEINLVSITSTGTLSGATTDFVIDRAGIIKSSGYNSKTTNVAANTVTTAGVIFK